MDPEHSCTFCRLLSGELPLSRVYQDGLCVAFMDIHPVNPGHVLVAPRQHAERLVDLDEATVGHLLVVGRRIGAAIRSTSIRCEGLNYSIADGRAAGQEVPHVHLHCIPRFEGDGFEAIPLPSSVLPRLRYFFPQEFGRLADRDTLDRIAAEIRSAIGE